jgi:hypothetical protein
MCQINPQDKDNRVPFQHRIKGRKVIMDPSTIVMEMVRDSENYRTNWIIHKSRYTESIGKDLHTGYNKGKFIEYTDEFRAMIQQRKDEIADRKQIQLIDKSVKTEDVVKKEEETV